MPIAVLGAGLQGACIALELARRGHEVDLIDQDVQPLNRASLRNEGKIHLGFVYARLGGFVHEARPLCRKRVYGGSVSMTNPYTLSQRLAYLAAHRELGRRARLTGRERVPLLAAIALRQAGVIAGWLPRLVPTDRLGWYVSPAELPRRLRKLTDRLRGLGPPSG